MSEQNTSNPKTIASGSKVKDPKKVAAGKRLGTMSKKAKEETRLERERQAQAQAQQNAEMEADNKHALYLVGGLVVVGVAYYSYLNKDKVTEMLPQMLTSNKREEPPKQEKSKRIFDD